jgi:tight adherence protein C
MSTTIPWPVFFAIGTFLSMIALVVGSFRSRADQRIAELSRAPEPSSPRTVPTTTILDAQLNRRVAADQRKAHLKDRLLQAGFYSNRASLIFFTVRCLSLLVPLLVAYVVGRQGWLPMTTSMMLGMFLGVAGIIAPSFMLDFKKRARQQSMRRALPDALDVLNICLEGGMSLSGSVSRVAQELASAHPALALELAIVDRETRMGRSVADSIRSFADRFDLSELRSLASVIAQAERYGASVAQALEVYAETMRVKRSQAAEERAQKAVIKVIFPTLFCIFPALFVVVLGPAAISIYNAFIDK